VEFAQALPKEYLNHILPKVFDQDYQRSGANGKKKGNKHTKDNAGEGGGQSENLIVVWIRLFAKHTMRTNRHLI